MRIEIHNGIFVRRFGNADAPKLVCLHGFADSGQMFVPLSGTTLVNGFELIAVDLPGFGVSPRDPSVNSIREYAQAVAGLASVISPNAPVGLVGHSIASAIAVTMVSEIIIPPVGVFSVEGNLTEADAYFSGKAADWDSANEFKEVFSNEIWSASDKNPDLRRYFGWIVMADAEAMWELGRDAKRISVDDAVGKAYTALDIPTLYYWGSKTTPGSSQTFIEMNSLMNRQYDVESHWPTVANPDATAVAINEFFGDVR